METEELAGFDGLVNPQDRHGAFIGQLCRASQRSSAADSLKEVLQVRLVGRLGQLDRQRPAACFGRHPDV
jgi:hypothetical protein